MRREAKVFSACPSRTEREGEADGMAVHGLREQLHDYFCLGAYFPIGGDKARNRLDFAGGHFFDRDVGECDRHLPHQ